MEVSIHRVESAKVRTEYFAPSEDGSRDFWVTYITAKSDAGEELVTRLFSHAPPHIEAEES
jgi:hypothetical protein